MPGELNAMRLEPGAQVSRGTAGGIADGWIENEFSHGLPP